MPSGTPPRCSRARRPGSGAGPRYQSRLQRYLAAAPSAACRTCWPVELCSSQFTPAFTSFVTKFATECIQCGQPAAIASSSSSDSSPFMTSSCIEKALFISVSPRLKVRDHPASVCRMFEASDGGCDDSHPSDVLNGKSREPKLKINETATCERRLATLRVIVRAARHCWPRESVRREASATRPPCAQGREPCAENRAATDRALQATTGTARALRVCDVSGSITAALRSPVRARLCDRACPARSQVGLIPSPQALWLFQ